MKKSVKLLSVLLTVLMIFSSVSVGAFAAKTSYRTAANLDALDAYSPYGTVTRLSSEERMSILFDSLDGLIMANPSLNMGQLFNVAGLSLTINLTSVKNICGTVDNVYSLLNNTLVKIVKGLLGVIADAKVNTWQKGMTRESYPQLTIVAELFELLSNNTTLVDTVLTSGLDLGVANSALGDMSAINNAITNLPVLINGIVLPLMSRQDDDAAQRAVLGNTASDLVAVAQNFVNGLFTKPMSWTSYRVDASGNDLGYTLPLPSEADGTTRYFVKSADGKEITQWDYQYAGVLGDPAAGYVETVTYTLSDTEEFEGSGTYLYKAPEGYTGDQSLKWYKADGKADANGNIQSSYWLPSVKEAFENGTLSLQINGTDTALDLIYRFIPYVFAEMAPVVLNGSVKKLIAEAFDVVFTELGGKGSEAVAAEASATGNPDSFFTRAQEYYTWEYSDYKVINGVPYYRFQDTYFKGEIPSNISTYYDLINWDWVITDDFMNEFIPASSSSGRILTNLNNFVRKVINTCVGDKYKAEVLARWEAGDNSKVPTNILNTARYLMTIAPTEVFGDFYDTAQFYDVMMTTGDVHQSVIAVACQLIKMIMPQISFSDDIVNQPILAVAAAVVRELCTQLMPSYDFDAMIYSNYETRTLLPGKDANYWLDTILYMGVNLGMFYLRNLADLGEDDNTNGYYAVMKNLGVIPSSGTADAMKFTATSQYVGGTANSANASWLYMVDWIVDWALETDIEWCWHFNRLVNVGETVSLTTYENPLKKIDSVLLTLLPLDQILNATGLDNTTYGSNTFTEAILKGGLIDGISNLDLPKLVGILNVPSGILTSTNIIDQLVVVIRNLLNNILYKVAGNANIIDPAVINSAATLLNHNNLKTTVKTLVGKLYTAYNNGLLDPILPLVNFFIGWKTDPQVFANPTLTFTNSEGTNYYYTAGTETLTVKNSSSGMLLKHRSDNKTDKSNLGSPDGAYTITLAGITSNDGTISAAATDAIAPGESVTYTLTNTSTTPRTVALSVNYSFEGKTGTAIGGAKKANTYMYVSPNKYDGFYKTMSAKVGSGLVYVNAGYSLSEYNYVVTDPAVLQQSVENINYRLENWRDTACELTEQVYTSGNSNLVANNAELTKTKTLGKDGAEDGSGNFYVYPVKLADTVDVTTLPSGQAWSIGTMKVTIKGKIAGVSKSASATGDFGTLYYADLKDLIDLYEDEVSKNRAESDYSSASWATYLAAMLDTCKYIDVQAIKDTSPADFTANYTDAKIADKLTALQDAIKGLKLVAATGVTPIIEALDACEDLPNGRDYNFQDYALFEYFKYENERTKARAMINSAKGPVEPTNRIENEDASYDLIQAIVAAETNTNIKTGINATVVAPSAEEMTAYNEAVANWVAPSYSDLEVQDQAEKLSYYMGFMKRITKAADKTFLAREIATADAKGYVEADYSVDSWSRYTEAYANAVKVYNDATAKESEVFDVKYELMVAQTQLMDEYKSMKDNGYLDRELNVVVEQANNVIEYFGTYYKLANGVTADEAFAQLVKALGVDYNVTVDGVKHDGILYSRSAITFQQYDREATLKNKRAVDAAADKLRAALKNFVVDVAVESTDTTTVEQIDQDVRFIQGIVPGSITSIETLLTKVNCATAGTTLVGAANKDGMFGTGATVTVKGSNDVDLAKYFVVIYGDVNGDGAIDGFDTFEVNKHMNRLTTLLNIYETAGDTTDDGIVDVADYSQIKQAAAGYDAVSQVK